MPPPQQTPIAFQNPTLALGPYIYSSFKEKEEEAGIWMHIRILHLKNLHLLLEMRRAAPTSLPSTPIPSSSCLLPVSRCHRGGEVYYSTNKVDKSVFHLFQKVHSIQITSQKCWFVWLDRPNLVLCNPVILGNVNRRCSIKSLRIINHCRPPARPPLLKDSS